MYIYFLFSSTAFKEHGSFLYKPKRYFPWPPSSAPVSHLLLPFAVHCFTCTSFFDLKTWFSFSNRFTSASAHHAPSSQLSLTFTSLFPSLSFILSSLISFIPSNPHLFFIVEEERESKDIVLPPSAQLVVCTQGISGQVELKDLKQARVEDLWNHSVRDRWGFFYSSFFLTETLTFLLPCFVLVFLLLFCLVFFFCMSFFFI